MFVRDYINNRMSNLSPIAHFGRNVRPGDGVSPSFRLGAQEAAALCGERGEVGFPLGVPVGELVNHRDGLQLPSQHSVFWFAKLTATWR